MTEHLVFFSIAGLRFQDIDRANTPTLYEWAARGALAELTPTFPCVTSCVQASMLTGTGPAQHGVIANGFFHRARRAVEFWVGRNNVITGEQTWDAIKNRRPDFVSAVWHAQNIKDAGADFIVAPAPLHEPDGTPKLWCYSKPEGTYQKLLDALGHFPLQHYWGPMANIESTRWILRAAAWMVQQNAPNYHWIYIPYLDYAAQKFGPDSEQAKKALGELDHELAEFAANIARTPTGKDVVYLAAGEYALTDVRGAVYANRLLREAGLLAVREEGGAEYLDFATSKAFAMVDHQLAHLYVADGDAGTIGACAAVFTEAPGVAGVFAGAERAQVGLEHERSGDLVLVSEDDRWFAYSWWLTDAAAPPFARTVDIHSKPGYDPGEMFFDPATRSISLDASLIRGSHGAPATRPQQRTALICSAATNAVEADQRYRDTDVKRISLEILGL